MTYRNTEEALRARIDALEAQLREADRRLADVLGCGDNSTEVKLREQLRGQAGAVRQIQEELRAVQGELAMARSAALRRSLTSRDGGLVRLLAIGVGIGLVLLTAYALALSADSCTSPLQAGYVVGRYHHPSYITTSEVCTGSGNTRSCIPVVMHHPERWTVRVALDAQTREIDLEHEAWSEVEMGSWFCSPGETCPPEPGAHWAEEE